MTIENFLVWKAKFELDMAELRRKKLKDEEQGGKPKLTGKSAAVPPLPVCRQSEERLMCVSAGKQLFERDHNLDTSDIQFLEDGKEIFFIKTCVFYPML